MPLRRVPIRIKLAMALVVPTCALVVMAGYQYLDIAHQADATERQTRLATAADGPTGLVTALQNERNFTVVEIIGQVALAESLPVDTYEVAYPDTDSALDGFRDQLANSDDETVAAYGPAVQTLDGLQALRDRVAGFSGERTLVNLEAVSFADEIFAEYTAMIEPFFAGTSQIADAVDDPDLRQGAVLVDQAAREAEVVGQLSRYLIAFAVTTEGGVNTVEEIDTIASLWAQSQRYYTGISIALSGEYANLPYDFDEFFAGIRTHVEQAFDTGSIDIVQFLDAVTVPTPDSYNGFRDNAAARLRELADELNSEAAERQRFNLVVMILTVVLATGAVITASLSITRPLHSLREQADNMARRDLPEAVSEVLNTPLGEDVPSPALEPVKVDSHDEVGDLAVSLNQVQESTLRLAVGQAVLRKNVADSLVNLGRRNQSLLARQLDFITQLERDEANPDTLANLFRLDHLATRMRRNAESLLVLAGVQTPRRWTAPVKIGDVVRASLSEVEDYRRASVGYVEAVTIPGSVAADLAHLMAELIENALIFSPPEEVVEVNGLTQIAGYTISIADRGLGMRPYEIAQANRRLAGGESFTVAPSKYLGHYVAGNLAVRHDIHVQLRPTLGHGVTATIHVPAWLAAVDEGSKPAPRYGSFLLGQRTGEAGGAAGGGGAAPQGGWASGVAAGITARQ